MNLRILKKLSKRAAPLLSLLGDDRQQFPAERCENYTHTCGHDRKHWERHGSIHSKPLSSRYLHYLPRHGKRYVTMREPAHPLKGTIMVGAMCGYYEPEWEEETAWESLCNLVIGHFTDWVEVDTGDCTAIDMVVSRDFYYPSEVFKAAEEIIALRRERGEVA